MQNFFVVFTDGHDTVLRYTAQQALTATASTAAQSRLFAVGLQSDDLDTSFLQQLTNGHSVVASDEQQLEQSFLTTVSSVLSSVAVTSTLYYCSPRSADVGFQLRFQFSDCERCWWPSPIPGR